MQTNTSDIRIINRDRAHQNDGVTPRPGYKQVCEAMKILPCAISRAIVEIKITSNEATNKISRTIFA